MPDGKFATTTLRNKTEQNHNPYVCAIEGLMTAIGEQSLRWFSAERVEAEPDLAILVRDYSALLYRVALSVLRNPSEAEDVVQDVYVRVLQHQRELARI